MTQYDIFVSYSHADRRLVKQLASDMSNKGIRVWYDSWEMRPGDVISDRILAGIKEASYLLIIISEGSLKSNWVRFELNAATVSEIEDKGVTVIPAITTGVSFSDIPLSLRMKYGLNLSTKEEYHSSLDSLTNLINSQTESPLKRPTRKSSEDISKQRDNLIMKDRTLFILASTIFTLALAGFIIAGQWVSADPTSYEAWLALVVSISTIIASLTTIIKAETLRNVGKSLLISEQDRIEYIRLAEIQESDGEEQEEQQGEQGIGATYIYVWPTYISISLIIIFDSILVFSGGATTPVSLILLLGCIFGALAMYAISVGLLWLAQDTLPDNNGPFLREDKTRTKLLFYIGSFVFMLIGSAQGGLTVSQLMMDANLNGILSFWVMFGRFAVGTAIIASVIVINYMFEKGMLADHVGKS